MSLPVFPTSTDLTREEAINQIISSIAMEEIGLSHIINAEGEKLQYILGTIEGVSGPDPAPTIEQILQVNESVRGVLQSAAENQTLLRSKLQNVLTSAVLTGPTGATGATGATGEAVQNIIYSSDLNVPLTANPAGESELVAVMGVSLSAGNIPAGGSTMDLRNHRYLALVVPYDGVITNINARVFLYTISISAGDTVEVYGQLYRGGAEDAYYTLIPESRVMLEPVVDSTAQAYDLVSGSLSGLNIPVVENELLFFVFSVESSGTVSSSGVSCFMGGSITLI